MIKYQHQRRGCHGTGLEFVASAMPREVLCILLRFFPNLRSGNRMVPDSFPKPTSLFRLRALRLLLLLLAALSRVPFARAELLPVRTYTIADGLAHNEVNRIVRDSRGFLWFCTADGLSRFDGYAFTNYGTGEGLPHRYVTDLLETRSGQFWVATYGGLVRFDPNRTPVNRVVYAND